MQTQINEGMGGFLQGLKNKLKLKILSIYVINDQKKQEIIDLIFACEDVDLLVSIDQKLDDILHRLGEITVRLLEKANPEILMEINALIQTQIVDSIRQKEEKEKMDLSELEHNLDNMLDKI